MGSRAMSNYLRQGVKGVIDLQAECYRQQEMARYARMGQESAEDFLDDIFGDSEIDSVNDEMKAKLKAYVKQLEGEWENE